VDERLEVTAASAWADSVSTGSCLFDALLDACKDEVGEDGWVGAFAEGRADNRACVGEDLYLGNGAKFFLGKKLVARRDGGYLVHGRMRLKMGLGSRILRHTRSH